MATSRSDGVTFDSREVEPGDLFIALKGEATDGHRFVDKAFAAGAAGALVSETVDGPACPSSPIRRARSTISAAPSRARTSARIIGVTGSVGKTGTKEALFAALDRAAPGRAHRSVKSYNNHTGVPLSLARMPREARFGVFEMGMNHAGELAALTRLVRPHVASSPRSPRPIANSSPARRRSPTPRARSSRGWSRAAPRSSPSTARIATG